MDDWDRYTLRTREHYSDTIRLHGGHHHGRVITVPPRTRQHGILLTAPPMPPLILAEPFTEEVEIPPPLVYRRQELAIYDDVDHVVDLYEYWHLEGTPLPRFC